MNEDVIITRDALSRAKDLGIKDDVQDMTKVTIREIVDQVVSLADKEIKAKKTTTLKLLFINFDTVDYLELSKAVDDLPIYLIFQRGLVQSYIVDTGIEVKKL